MKEHDHGEIFFKHEPTHIFLFLNANDMDICWELKMLWFGYEKIQTKQSGCMDYSKLTCNGMQKLKDNYSSSLKSMSKTISPFLIMLTMTHKMEFVSSAASVSVT